MIQVLGVSRDKDNYHKSVREFVENRDKMDEEKGNFGSEIESLKRNKMEILELTNTVSEIKNSLDGFKYQTGLIIKKDQ